jgi:preprotein translocase subunit SecD
LTKVEISGGFHGQQGVERAKQIAELLNAGSLPVDLKEIYSNSDIIATPIADANIVLSSAS